MLLWLSVLCHWEVRGRGQHGALNQAFRGRHFVSRLQNLIKVTNVPFLSLRLALQVWLAAPSSPISPWSAFHPPPWQPVTLPSARLTRTSTLTWSTTCAPCTAAPPCPWSQRPEDSALLTVSSPEYCPPFHPFSFYSQRKWTWTPGLHEARPPQKTGKCRPKLSFYMDGALCVMVHLFL